MPERIQLKRTKGWRMPENTMSVARPTKWGNPFHPHPWEEYPQLLAEAREVGVYCFRAYLEEGMDGFDPEHLAMVPMATDVHRKWMLDNLGELRGKNLACWCPLDQDCHADVLLELANTPSTDTGAG